MNLEFARLMARATRLTRAGDLSGATAAVKAALSSAQAQAMHAMHRGTEPHGADTDDVIELPARVVRPSGEAGDSADADADDDVAIDAERASGEFIRFAPPGVAGQLGCKLFVPAQARETGALLPLVVMLHGCSQDPDDFALGTGMNLHADTRGCFVLYPAQASDANPSRCWNWFMPAHQQGGAGEPELIAGLTRAALHRYPIDPRRVYVAGLSAGGAMAAILAAAYPELIAAVAVHSGLPVGAASDLKSALVAMHQGARLAGAASWPDAADAGHLPPVLVVHGDQDHTVHPLNGDRVAEHLAPGTEMSIHDLEVGGRPCTRRVWRDMRGRVRAEHWLVHGAGHAWSGGNGQGSYADPSGPDASALMLDFFAAHPHAELG
jgi:poly(hydroxyalkanoate) depolymerase family esterase